ncbi:hypothetical protein VHUM_04309 [Vanrija humicola]|uniref:DNA-directed RNA polymerase III subunit Rpc5 n=1 Tax=Vanrija humicola TaxID=5417 RepID=A0A7D8ZFQ2_VANHU|nr:hypothetical protein VHUM_04309 [Vanrija humicola]
MSRIARGEVTEVADSILESPEGSEYGGETIPAEAAAGDRDVPGPSSMYVPPRRDPRPGSPELPDLQTRPFPPDLDMDDAEEDEIVARLPVYLSTAVHPALQMFQYPLQHRSLSVPQWAADRGKRITARMKEGVGRVEIEIPVDADPKVWREERAKELEFVPDVANGHGEVDGGYRRADERDKRKKEKEPKWGDKMRLRSEAVPVSSAATYFSGIIHDGALHLHPVSKVSQFRTALNYFDDFDIRNRGGSSRREEEEEKKKAAARREPLPKTLDDANNDGSGSLKDFRNKMWATQQREEEDKWVPYEFHEGAEDDKVIESLEQLLLPEDRRELLECKSRGLDFLNRE